MHNFSFYRIRASSSKIACELADKILNSKKSAYYFYSVIGCLSEKNESYIYNNSENLRWNPINETIEKLNKLYEKDFGEFNILSDLNEVDIEDNVTIPLWQLNYKGESGELYIVFTDIKYN